MEVQFTTHCNVTKMRPLFKSEKFALLDWILGEMNSLENEEYGAICKYPESIKEFYSTVDKNPNA